MFIPSTNIGPLDTLVFPGPISISALAVQLYELAVHWSDEVEYLWKGRFNAIKALYFFVRYILLFSQVMSEAVSYKLWTVDACIVVFACKTVLAQATLTAVEIILLIRVYALYNQSFHMKRFLIIVFSVAQLLEIWATGRMVSHLRSSNECKPPMANKSTLIQFGVGASISQLVVFLLSLSRLLTQRSGRTPLTSLMLKEGVGAFLLIVVLLAVMMSYYEVFRRFDYDLGNAAFAWYIALISAGASRLILNMRRLAVKSRRRRQLRHLSLHNQIDTAALTESFYDSDDTINLTSFYE